MVQTPTGSALPPPGGHIVLGSPQYGPAWIADCHGSSHAQRVAALVGAGWTINPDNRDDVARTYARLLDEPDLSEVTV